MNKPHQERMTRMAQTTLIFVLAILVPMVVGAQTERKTPAVQKAEGIKETFANLDFILDRDLAATTKKRRLPLFAIAPRYEDLFLNNRLRLDFNLKWGLTNQLQAGLKLRMFVENPFGEDEIDATGVADLFPEIKFHMPSWPHQELDAAIGMKVKFPLTNDDRLSDGSVTLTPFIVLQRILDDWHHLLVYTQLGVTIFTSNPKRELIANEFQNTFFVAAPGMIYPFSEDFLVMLDTQWETDGKEVNLYITPGLRWVVPQLRFLPFTLQIDFGWRLGVLGAQGEYDVGSKFIFGGKIRKAKRKPALSALHVRQ